MTPEERRQEREKEAIDYLHRFQAEIDRNGWSDDLCVRILASFAQAREAAVLEEAANWWDTAAEGPCKDGNDFEWAMRVAQWCHQQAKERRA